MSENRRFKRRSFIKYAGVVLGAAAIGKAVYCTYIRSQPKSQDMEYSSDEMPLLEPVSKGVVSVEEAMANRRSIRLFTGEPLTLQEVGQLLWASQGITEPRWGFKTAPSAGGIYPLEVYIVVAKGRVEDLPNGIYHYRPDHNSILPVTEGDFTGDLAVAALDQPWVSEANMSIVITAVYERTTDKYGERGIRYVHMESGHVGQNICLQAIALKLGVVTIGAFQDEQVQKVLGIPSNEKPLYVIPVGRPSCEQYNDPRCIFRD